MERVAKMGSNKYLNELAADKVSDARANLNAGFNLAEDDIDFNKDAHDAHVAGTAEQHDASDIVNDSSVTGADVDNALDTLKGDIDNIVAGAVEDNAGWFNVNAGGTANAITGTYSGISALTGIKVALTVASANTDTVTFNLNSLGADTIKYYGLSGDKVELSGSNWVNGATIFLIHDGTDWMLLPNVIADIMAKQDRGVPFPIDEWIGNTKDIWCNSKDGEWEDGDYTASFGGTTEINQTNKKIGNFGQKIITSVSLGGGHVDSVIDLSLLSNGEASTTSDYIQFGVYSTTAEIAKLNVGLIIRFLCDTAPTGTNHFEYTITKASLSDGWNFFKLAKSAFSILGSPDWANVKGVDFITNGLPSSEVTWTIDAIQLIKKDPSTAKANPFQRAGSADDTINSGTWYVGWDEAYKSNVVRNLADPTNDKDALVGTKAYSNKFEVEANVIINDAGLDSYGYGWYSDDDNMMTAQLITSTTFRLNVVDSTGSNTFDVTVPAVVVGQLLNMRIVRNSASVIAILNTNGDTYSVIGDTDSTGDGYSTVRDRTDCDPADTILDFGITTTERASQAGWSAKTDDITSRKQGNNLDNALSQMEGEGLTEAFREWNYLHNTNTHNDLYFQDYTVFTSGAGTLSNDPTNKYWGDNSVKLLNNDNGASTMYFDLESITLDFTKSINGESIDDNGYIIVKLFLSDQAMTTSVVLTLSTGATIDANSKQYTITGLATGNNYVAVKKSAFVTNNNGAWSGLQSIRFQYPTNAGYQNEYVSFQLVQLVRVDPDNSTQYSYFQKQIADGVYQNTITWAGTEESILGVENNKVRWKLLGTNADINAYTFSKNYSTNDNFIYSSTMITGSATDASRIYFYIDDENYVGVFLEANTITLRKEVSNSITDDSDTLDLDEGQTLNCVIEKTGTAWSLKVEVDGVLQVLDIQPAIADFGSQSGYLVIGGITSNPCYIESATITSTKVATMRIRQTGHTEYCNHLAGFIIMLI
jgi:hypothetical protein